MNTNELVYQAVLRDFRNAVVVYLRARLKEAYPDSWTERLRRPFKEEWKGMEESVSQLAAGPFATLKHRDDFDYLSVNHFQNIFEAYAPVLISADGLSEVAAGKRKQSLLQLLREIKSVRDVLAHPAESDLSAEDAHRVVDSARRVLVMLRLPAARTLHRIQRQLLAEPSSTKTIGARSSAREEVLSPRQRPPAGLNRLPAALTPMIGRERQIAEIRKVLVRKGVRLLTLTGPGGVGKTRLALDVAEDLRKEFEDGVVWLPLEQARAASDVPGLLMEWLEILPDRSDDPARALQDYLHDKQILLVLDNFEHILAAKGLLHDVLKGCKKVKALVTSRSALEMLGEQQYQVPPLDLPGYGELPPLEDLQEYPAVSLFLQRVRSVRPRFRLTNSNASAFVEICRRLDGLPLALELVSPRLRLLSPAEALKDLGNQLKRSESRQPRVPRRQRTLQDTMEWSYGLLNDAEKAVFRQVSLFFGGFYSEDAQTVCRVGKRTNISKTLESLLTNSLVKFDSGRFEMLDTIRQFATQKLLASGEGTRTAEAFIDWGTKFCKLAVTAPDRPFGQELLNLSFALRLSEKFASVSLTRPIKFASELGFAAFMENEFPLQGDVKQSLLRMLRKRKKPSTQEQARALQVVALLSIDDQDDRAPLYFRKSVDLWLEAGETHSAIACLDDLAEYVVYHDGEAKAIPYVEQRLALLKQIGDSRGTAAALLDLADLVFDADLAAAEGLDEEWKLRQEVSSKTELRIADLLRAAEAEVSKKLASDTNEFMADVAKVRRLVEEALILFRLGRNREGSQSALIKLAATSFYRQDYAEALTFLAEAKLAAIKETTPASWRDSAVPFSTRLIGFSLRLVLRLSEGEKDRSVPKVWRPMLIALARIACDQNDFTKAARLIGAAEQLSGKQPVSVSNQARESRDLLGRISEGLGKGACAIAVSEGRDLSLEEALWYAYETRRLHGLPVQGGVAGSI